MSTDTTPDDYVPPKVFISYSRTNDEYIDWVTNLATRMQRQGIKVVFDRWHLQPGQDRFTFMEQMVNDPEVSKVLVLCDKRYTERANRREGGVGTETTIISQEVYEQVNSDKFIPVITERGPAPDSEAYVPTYIKSRIFVDLSDVSIFEKGYEDLWRAITGRPSVVEPPLGKPPAYLLESNKPTSPTTFALRTLENALTNAKPNSTGIARDYLDRLNGEIASLRVDTDTIKETSERDARMQDNLEHWDPLRNEWVSFLRLICRYGSEPRLFDTLPTFFENMLAISKSIPRHRWNEHLNLILHEAFLYAVTVLLQEQRFDTVALLLSSHYRDPELTRTSQRYGVFYHGDTRYVAQTLNEIWSEQEKGMRYKYPQQAWLQRRADGEIMPFDMLREADIILWLRYKLETDPNEMFMFLSWFPATVGSLDDYHWRVDNFPLWQRATSRRFFDQFKVVLGVESKEDLLQRWNRAFPKNPARNWDGMDGYLERVFNLESIATQG